MSKSLLVRAGVAVLIAFGAAAATVPASQSEARELKLASFVPPMHPMHRFLMEPMAERVAEESNGELTIRIHHSGELGRGPVEQYPRVVTGVADVIFGLHGYTSNQFPRTLLIELPGISNGPEQATRMMWAAYEDHLAADYQQVVPLALWTNNDATLITREKPVRSPADMEGMKFRVPSQSAARIVEAWGGTPVFMPVTRVYESLDTGVIDGVFIGGSAVRSFRLHEAGNYMTVNIPTTIAAFYILINKGVYDGLSASEREALDRVAGLEISLEAARAYRRAAEAGIQLFRENKEVIELSDEERQAFADGAARVRQETIDNLREDGIEAEAIVQAMEAGKQE